MKRVRFSVLIQVKKMSEQNEFEQEILDSQVSDYKVSLRGSAMGRSNTLTDKYNTSELNAIAKLGFSNVQPPSKKAREVYVDLIETLQKNPAWTDKKRSPQVAIKMFENDPVEINKFKFQIRNKLDKNNLLVVFHSQQTLSHFYSTVQLSEKVEPDSFWGFLKVSGAVSKKQKKNLYKSKIELKGRAKKKDSDRKTIRELINGYFLETWARKRETSPDSLDPVASLIRVKLSKIDETSKTNEAPNLIQNGINPILSEETKGSRSRN